MKTERNILIAFILNLAFSIFEFVGGIFTGSVAILSDALHDLGDATSIGISYFMERKSKRKPDETYTYGYGRYSVLGGFITTLILFIGSIVIIVNAIFRIITPAEINYNGMIIFAIVGVCVNFCAAYFTRGEGSINQKAVNLHMLEDVLGWLVVLVGAVVMRFTDFALIDPIMSIGVSIYIMIHAVMNLRAVTDLFLEKVPYHLNINEVKKSLEEIEEVIGVHHIHIWSMSGSNHYATVHVVTDGDPHEIKDRIRAKFREFSIMHVTIELETSTEHCHEMECHMEEAEGSDVGHHHHHHHGHHHSHHGHHHEH